MYMCTSLLRADHWVTNVDGSRIHVRRKWFATAGYRGHSGTINLLCTGFICDSVCLLVCVPYVCIIVCSVCLWKYQTTNQKASPVQEVASWSINNVKRLHKQKDSTPSSCMSILHQPMHVHVALQSEEFRFTSRQVFNLTSRHHHDWNVRLDVLLFAREQRLHSCFLNISLLQTA